MRPLAFLCLVLAAPQIGGCLADIESTVGSGAYELDADMNGSDPDAETLYGTTLVVDRQASTAVFTLPDASTVERGIAARPRADWWQDCAMNTNAYAIEVLDLVDAPMSLGTYTFEAPVLVAECGGDEGDAGGVFLTDALEGHEGYGRCPEGAPCLYLHLPSESE